MAGPTLPLHVLAFGPPEVRLGEKPVTFATRKTLALLIYLALEARPQPREHLAALLWPEAGPERSLASLRNTLGHLQSALRRDSGQAQTAYLSVTHTALALNSDGDISTLTWRRSSAPTPWPGPSVRAARPRKLRSACPCCSRPSTFIAATSSRGFRSATRPASTTGPGRSAKSGAAA